MTRKRITPSIGADEALGNDLAARKDAILEELQSVRQQRLVREARYNRDRKRLDADYAADLAAVDDLVWRLERALAGVNAANEAMAKAVSNVVKLRAAE
jgi:hypothetical protein